MEPQRPQIAKAILRKKEQTWRYHTPWFPMIPQSYSNQNSMVLAEQQTHRSMVQNWELRNKFTHTWRTNLQEKSKKHTMKKEQFLQQMELRKRNSHMQKNQTRPLSYTTHKNLLSMD